MKGKKRKIKKNFHNRLIYFFVTIGILVALAVGVYAFGTFNPSYFGHSAGEIAAPAGCTAGQVLQYNGTSFVCGSGGAGGGACPSGMTTSYTYANEGEDTSSQVRTLTRTTSPAFPLPPGANCYTAEWWSDCDTPGGPRVIRTSEWLSQVATQYGYVDTCGNGIDMGTVYSCSASESRTCHDIKGSISSLSDYEVVCKRRATLKCIE
jgi:hypothetical protein